MKLKNRLLISFIVIMTLPLILSSAFIWGIAQYQIKVIEKTYGLTGNEYQTFSHSLNFLKEMPEVRQFLLHMSVSIICILILTAMVLVLWVYGSMIRQINRLQEAAKRVQSGDLDFELKPEGNDEMGQLIQAFEDMRARLKENAEEKIQDRFERSNETFRRLTNRIYRRQQMAHPMSEFLGTATIAIVLWYGGTLILSSNSPIDASTFIYYLVIFYSIINPAKDLSKASYAIQKGLASMDRVDKILKAESDINDPENPKSIALTESICYRDVWFKYQHEWVLKGIDLTIPKGRTVALVGQSGSGKSTLVDLLPRFYDVDKGSITIDGTDVRDATLYDLRSLMGNVNQEAILFNDTFFNNISFGVEGATLEQVQEAARIANAHDFIMASENGYDTNIGDRGGKLSGGQRQRISIARAILKNPPILILDEATSALDTESERLVQEALENLMRNRTTIVIAHRLSTIRNADEICVMHEGEIVERGRHEKLIGLDGYYKKLCDMQSF